MHPTTRPKSLNPIPLYSLFIANAISLVGNVFSLIAIPWFVLQTTGSATQTGITGFFTILPVVLTGFLGGTLIDRLGYKRTSIIADIASGVTTALIPLIHFTIGLEFWQLLILVFLGALLDTPGGTAREALLPELAEQAGMPIERVTSLTHVIERGARLVGAPLAGLLIGVIGTANVLWLDAASFFVSAAIIGFVITAPKFVEKEEKTGKYFDELRDGLRFIAHDKLILSIVIMVMLTNFLDAIFGGVVQPVYVKEVFGNALNLGLLIAANGGGAVVGGLIFAGIGHRLPRHATFVAAFVLTGFRFWVYALYPPLAVLLVTTFITSIGAGPLNPIIGAVEFERIPPNMRGRVFGAITAGAWIAMPLGMLLGGVLTETFGTFIMMIGLAIIFLITTLSMAFIPAMKEMNRKN
ncbi:MAG: MFS transporter [Anaerolineae bacterium]|nr:MFS transporter [Anaerolineae bacterium]MCI0607530.1 MFS transporter [Anaerolineae bacterium]